MLCVSYGPKFSPSHKDFGANSKIPATLVVTGISGFSMVGAGGIEPPTS